MNSAFGKIEPSLSAMGTEAQPQTFDMSNIRPDADALGMSRASGSQKSNKKIVVIFAVLLLAIAAGAFFGGVFSAKKQVESLVVGKDTYIDVNEAQNIAYQREVQPEKAAQLTASFDINDCLSGNSEQHCVEIFSQTLY